MAASRRPCQHTASLRARGSAEKPRSWSVARRTCAAALLGFLASSTNTVDARPISVSTDPPAAALLARPLDRVPLAQLPHPAVARVIAEERGAESHGSGTLIDVRDDCGLVVTNWHVIRDATGAITVRRPS